LVELNPDAIAFDVAGYVQRTKSKRNDRRLSLARASKVRNYMRDDLGVEVPITISGNRVPAKNGDKWFARRATVRAVQPPEDTTPELQDEMNAVWGTWDLSSGAMSLPDANKGTWSYPPETWEYQWYYSIDDSTWFPLLDGANAIYYDEALNYRVAYDVSGVTTDSVTMAATGNRNSFQECVYVKVQVRVSNAGFQSEWTDSNELAPLHPDCGWTPPAPPG
jgi:hypothetical protein